MEILANGFAILVLYYFFLYFYRTKRKGEPQNPDNILSLIQLNAISVKPQPNIITWASFIRLCMVGSFFLISQKYFISYGFLIQEKNKIKKIQFSYSFVGYLFHSGISIVKYKILYPSLSSSRYQYHIKCFSYCYLVFPWLTCPFTECKGKFK